MVVNFKGQLETKKLHMKPGEMKWSKGREGLLIKRFPIALLDCVVAPCEKLQQSSDLNKIQLW